VATRERAHVLPYDRAYRADDRDSQPIKPFMGSSVKKFLIIQIIRSFKQIIRSFYGFGA